MTSGHVYLWVPDANHNLGGSLNRATVPLQRLQDRRRLTGQYVSVHNAGAINLLDPLSGETRSAPIGNAEPNDDGDFVYEPGRGGGRLDKVMFAEPDFQARYIQASHFGEVNTYYHLDLIGSYIGELLQELGVPALPRVEAVVNAHHAVTEINGIRDGVRRTDKWLPFQGGHYRLPSPTYNIAEHHAISADGEIHLGPGWRLLEHGALVEARGDRYRANASHNAGILYHEYGHHITRHTADFRANALRPSNRQDNRKTALDEAVCDYWAATMLDTPHIWAWHHRHDAEVMHPRSLKSAKTMADYDSSPRADVHTNGTIFGAALWDIRTRISKDSPDGAKVTDRMLLQALALIGHLVGDVSPPTIKTVRQARESFGVGLTCLLEADSMLHAGRYRSIILDTFARRGICPELVSV